MKQGWPHAGFFWTKTRGPDVSGAFQRTGQLIRAGCRLGFAGNTAKALFCLSNLHAFKQPGQPLTIAVAAALEPDIEQSAVADFIADAGAAYSPRSVFHRLCFHACRPFPPSAQHLPCVYRLPEVVKISAFVKHIPSHTRIAAQRKLFACAYVQLLEQ